MYTAEQDSFTRRWKLMKNGRSTGSTFIDGAFCEEVAKAMNNQEGKSK